ncbi:endonuclease/exonuclease/phosphatase family protein [Arcanobacterium phocae]|uniref:endonuclease/exonuclease/phosphatase family protein n=1 Tax=Arcanobacterium phocae TaxID=131112 RepID=UPI001C0E9DD8|nr:endonuclease/exonuclease/phosphatase family protein [Arcanobacterium phocae]
MKFVWALVSLVIAGIALVLFRPDLVPYLSDYALALPFAQILSMRFWIGAVLLFGAVILAVFALVRYKLLNMGRIAGSLAGVLLIASMLQFGLLLERGVAKPHQLAPDRGVAMASAGNGDITVLTYNTLGGKTTAEQISQLVETNGVDVVVLPETAHKRGREVAELLAAQGLKFQQFDTHTSQYDPEFRSTVLLVSATLGEYEQSDDAPAGSAAVVARPVSGEGPEFIGVHPIAPVPALMEQWRSQTHAVYEQCGKSNFIMAGDFNSTIDHQMAHGFSCGDGARDAGSGAVGTWPATMPAGLSAPIDRVLHDGHSYRGTDAAIVKVGESDHRGLLVRLTPTK